MHFIENYSKHCYYYIKYDIKYIYICIYLFFIFFIDILFVYNILFFTGY